METAASKYLLLFLLFILFVICTSGSFLCGFKDMMHNEVKRDEQRRHSYRRELIQTIQRDFMNPPFTTFPTTPVTNPVTTPNPATVTVPPANPATATPTIPVTYPPITDPIYPPTPITNPVTTPSTTIPGGQPPINPVTTPVVAPPVITNAPAIPGQSWCVARGGLPETTTQVALDYACGIGGADCSAIQQGASCYNPTTLQNHASYAFNSYYQKNPVQTSCDFGGAAMITNLNPSTGSCIFASWSSSSASPTTTSPIPITTPTPTTTSPIPMTTPTPTMTSPIPMTTPTPTPTTDSSSGAAPAGSGTPPNVMSASNPAIGGGIAGYGESPPTASISRASMPSSLQPVSCCIVAVISIITGRMVLNI